MLADIDHPDWPEPTGHNGIRKCAGNTLTGRTQKCWDDLFTFTTISSTAGESLFSLSTPQSDLLRKYLQEKIRHH